jgi:hypothetical protein
MIKLINILKEQGEQEEQENPFDKYNLRVKDVELRDPVVNTNKLKAEPAAVQKRPAGTPGRKITTNEFIEFKNKLANQLGIKLTPERHRFFEAWRASENTNATFNPFASAWPGIGDLTWSLDPTMTIFNWTEEAPFQTLVKNYTTLDLGVDATAKTLQQNYFTNLLAALVKDDTKTAEEIVESSRAEIDNWGTGAELMLTKLKSIAPVGEEDTFEPPPPADELQTISTMNSKEADEHFWGIITKWVEAEYQFWEGKGKGPEGVLNPQTHDKMFDQFNDFWWDEDRLAQRHYRNTRNPALAWLLKQLNKYQDIQDLVKEYGSINVIFRKELPPNVRNLKQYGVPRGTPPEVINRVTWYLAVFNWISYIADTITDYFQDDCQIALEWASAGQFFRRSVQAEIDPIGGGDDDEDVIMGLGAGLR